MSTKPEHQQKKMMQCEMCGRMFPAEELVPGNRSGKYLCKNCSAEVNSCGCSDD